MATIILRCYSEAEIRVDFEYEPALVRVPEKLKPLLTDPSIPLPADQRLGSSDRRSIARTPSTDRRQATLFCHP